MLAAAAPLLFSACHADVTFRFDLGRDGRTLATTKAIVDDQLYALATSESTDPFGVASLQQRGWSTYETTDSAGNHILTASKLFEGSDLGHLSRDVSLVGRSLSPMQLRVSHVSGLLFDRDSASAVIPPFEPVALSKISPVYGGIESTVLSNALAAHFELRTPGKILSTNGHVMPDGSVRWDLNLQEPTTVQYSVRLLSIRHVAIALLILAGLAVSVPATAARAARKRTRLAHHPSE